MSNYHYIQRCYVTISLTPTPLWSRPVTKSGIPTYLSLRYVIFEWPLKEGGVKAGFWVIYLPPTFQHWQFFAGTPRKIFPDFRSAPIGVHARGMGDGLFTPIRIRAEYSTVWKMKGDPQIIGPANYIPGYYHLFSKDYIIFVELIVKPKKYISVPGIFAWNNRAPPRWNLAPIYAIYPGIGQSIWWKLIKRRHRRHLKRCRCSFKIWLI